MRRVLHLSILGLLTALLVPLSPRAPVLGAPLGQAPPLEIPTIPDPVPVQLDAGTTAFLALDFTDGLCGAIPACVDTLPAVAAGLRAARAAHVPVFYTSFTGSPPLSAMVAPQGEEPIVSFGPDKFFRTNLDEQLKQAGISTLVITGTVANGAVLYTAFEATLRGYTVVVAQDGISSRTNFATFYSRYQVLNGPGFANPQNMPLQAKAVTLSRTDLITYN